MKNKSINKPPNKIPKKMQTKGSIVIGVIIIILWLGLCVTSLYISFSNWNIAWSILTGKPVYTQEQAENYSKEQNKENVLLVNSLKNELNLTKIALETEQQININNVNLLQQKQTELTAKAAELSTLQVENAENKGKITAYETQINNLKEQLKFEQDKTNSDAQTILTLNNQIATLQTEKQNLENVNASNLNTINSLNSQVLNLNTTITELTNSVNNNLKTIQQLNARVSELQESIKYYELLIGAYNFEDKAVITFEYNGSVHSLQVIDKGTTPTTTTPADTDYIKFNYWQTTDGIEVDLTTFKPTENVTLIANLTYYYDVKYFDGEDEYNSTIIEKGQTAPDLQLTNTSDKRFLGWSLDRINIVTPSTITINENTTFYAIWETTKEVKFINGTEQVGELQKAFDISEITIPEVTKTGYRFLGWSLDGINIVDLTNYELTTNVVFMAKFELVEHIITFIADDATFATFNYSVENNEINVTAPTKSGYTFTYFSQENGKRVTLSELVVEDNITLTAHYLLNDLIGKYYYRNFLPNSYYDEETGENYPCGADIYNIEIKADGTFTYKKVTGVYNSKNDDVFAKILSQSQTTCEYIDFEFDEIFNTLIHGEVKKFGYYTGRPGNQIFVEELTTVFTFDFNNSGELKTLTLNKITYQKIKDGYDSPYWLID